MAPGETQFHYIFIPVVLGFMIARRQRADGRSGQPVGQLAIGFGLLCAGWWRGCGWPAAQLAILLVQVLLFIMALGAQLIYPVMSLEMIDMHPRTRGAAASVQSFIALGIGAVVMGMIAPMVHGDLRLLAWISLAGSILAWLLWRWGAALRGHEHAVS